jgi:serine/threonine protein phosphatase 1
LKGFVKKWLGGSGPEASPLQPSIPAGRRLYAIGDIHGRLDLLQELHRMIEADAREFDGSKTLVYLGDYIDRSEQSKEVIDLLLDAPLPAFETIHLLGNHEQTLIDFLQYPKAAASWLGFGGRETLRSYGVGIGRDFISLDINMIRDELKEKCPKNHLDFYRSCELLHVEGSYCFVHAGIRPGIPLSDQRNEDLLWIREDFTASQVIHDHVVVHGHSITDHVEFLPNRIGIDTGAFHTGILTCLVLEADHQRLLQTE